LCVHAVWAIGAHHGVNGVHVVPPFNFLFQVILSFSDNNWSFLYWICDARKKIKPLLKRTLFPDCYTHSLIEIKFFYFNIFYSFDLEMCNSNQLS
jgi:hypothetical protein